MNLRPRARKCMHSSEDDVGRDWLSEMPDEVMVHILSFMPIVDAVRTVLLRRFGNLWTLLPNLNFDARKFLRNPYDDVQWDDRHFCHFVRNVLMLYKRLSIDKFHLCVELNWYDESIQGADDIKTWLRFALDIVQAKEVKFCAFSQFEDSYFSTQFWDLSRDTFVSILPNFPFLCSLPKLPHIQNRWKCVVLELWEFHKSCLLGIYQLMRNSGHLEELIVYNTLQNSRLSYEAKLLPELSCPCVMPLLKTITFYDYGYGESWDHQLQLVEFLLKSSPVLDKLIISPSKCPLKGAEELEFVKRVSNFQGPQQLLG